MREPQCGWCVQVRLTVVCLGECLKIVCCVKFFFRPLFGLLLVCVQVAEQHSRDDLLPFCFLSLLFTVTLASRYRFGLSPFLCPNNSVPRDSKMSRVAPIRCVGRTSRLRVFRFSFRMAYNKRCSKCYCLFCLSGMLNNFGCERLYWRGCVDLYAFCRRIISGSYVKIVSTLVGVYKSLLCLSPLTFLCRCDIRSPNANAAADVIFYSLLMHNRCGLFRTLMPLPCYEHGVRIVARAFDGVPP